MSKARYFSLASLAVGTYCLVAAGAASAASIPASSLGDIARNGATSLVEDVQFRGRRFGGGPRIGRPVGGPRFVGRRGRGAIGAGIAAGVIGGLIGGALMNPGPVYAAPQPVYEPAPVYVAPRGGGSVEYCMRRYRSYNPNTGTYVGYDGLERPCP